MQRLDRVDASLILLIAIWGIAFASLNILGQHLGPMEILWFRYLPFVLLMLPWLLIFRMERLRNISLRGYGLYLLIGLLGVAGYHLPVNYALSTMGGPALSAPVGAIIITTTPLFSVLWSQLLGVEKFHRGLVFGYLLAVAGVAIVILYGKPGTELELNSKALILLIAPAMWSLYSILGKPLVAKDGAMTMSTLSMSLGTIALLPFATRIDYGILAELPSASLGWLIYLSLAATVVGYAIWNNALRTKTANQVTVTIYGIPVAATMASVIILDARITPMFVVGGALVLFGVYKLNQARSQAQPAPAADQPNAKA